MNELESFDTFDVGNAGFVSANVYLLEFVWKLEKVKMYARCIFISFLNVSAKVGGLHGYTLACLISRCELILFIVTKLKFLLEKRGHVL